MGVVSLLNKLRRVDATPVFGIDDYLALRGLSEISVSPEGQWVAYTLTSSDLKKDESRERVYIQSLAGGEPLPMTSAADNAGDASSPKWSPDGQYLAVLSDRVDETSQVWLYDRRGGDPQQITELKQGIESFDWSPDSQKLLLLVADPSPADLDEEKRPNPRPYVIDRLQFKEDYVGYLGRCRTHLHIVDVKSREIRQLTSGDFDDSEPAWAPDGKNVVFVSNRRDSPDKNRNTDLWLVNAEVSDVVPKQLTSGATADASPSWCPSGKRIVYTSTVSDAKPVYAIPQLTMFELESAESTVIDALREVQVFEPRFSTDGRRLLAITERKGAQELVAVNAENGDVELLVGGSEVVSEFSIGDGEIAVLLSQPDQPDELFVLRDETSRQVSCVNDAILDDLLLGNVEKHHYEGGDGTQLDVFVTFPPGFNARKSYPGVLMIHGGPQSQWDFAFDSEAQLLAARGYVVVMPNPRGSFGYGQAFAEAIYQDWGGIDYVDVMSAMDFAIAKGWIDEHRMAVYGWSYGGMLTNHIITKTDRFKAAISGASATLYVANYGHDQYQRWWEEELGLPWLAENREKWESLSPFYSLDKVTTPTLIVGGEDDWNVPIINSEQLYIGLKRQGIPTELIIYPSEGHEFSVPSYEKDLYERYFAWLGRYLSK